MIGEGSNAASEFLRVGWSILSEVESAPTFDRLRAFISDDFSSEDRRRGRPTFPDGDADAYAREMVSFWQTGAGMPHGKVREVLGVRGERFAACVVELDYGNGMTATWIQVVALDASLRGFLREVAFDVDDIEGALAELDLLSTQAAAGEAFVRSEQPQDWWPSGVTHWEGPPLDAWDAWSPVETRDHLARTQAPWCVVGGWAIDLAAARTTRVHEDLEIAVPSDEFGALRQVLSGFELYRVGNGQVRRRHEQSEPSEGPHQNWVLDPEAQRWRLDVMTEPGDRETWVFRRDPRITAPRATMVGVSDHGIPYLRPHGTLLFKAANVRDKDEHDLRVAVPLLTGAERRWLSSALRVVHPGHPWLAEI